MRDRRVEGLGLSEEAEAILREHHGGSVVVQEIAARGVDWRNGSQEARELSRAACWYHLSCQSHGEGKAAP